MALDEDGNRIDVLKPEEEWTGAEDELALGNSKALNGLFNGVDKNMFRLMKQCTVWLRILGRFSKLLMKALPR